MTHGESDLLPVTDDKCSAQTPHLPAGQAGPGSCRVRALEATRRRTAGACAYADTSIAESEPGEIPGRVRAGQLAGDRNALRLTTRGRRHPQPGGAARGRGPGGRLVTALRGLSQAFVLNVAEQPDLDPADARLGGRDRGCPRAGPRHWAPVGDVAPLDAEWLSCHLTC